MIVLHSLEMTDVADSLVLSHYTGRTARRRSKRPSRTRWRSGMPTSRRASRPSRTRRWASRRARRPPVGAARRSRPRVARRGARADLALKVVAGRRSEQEGEGDVGMLYEDSFAGVLVCMYELGSRREPPDRCYTHFALLPFHVWMWLLSLSSHARDMSVLLQHRASGGSMRRKWREEAGTG
jgi:hypothetical protein